MKKYSGIDLHSDNNVVRVQDESDRVLYRRRLPNDLGKVLEALEPHRAELLGVVVEATYNCYWLIDGLQAAGYNVQLAHPAGMKRYEGLKHSDDQDDAGHLAQALRLGILHTGYIYPREQRGLRDLARRRMQLVRQRTMNVLAMENVQARETGVCMHGAQIKRLGIKGVEDLRLSEDVTLGMKANVAVVDALQEQIDQIERHLAKQLEPRSDYRLLISAPGIGRRLAPVILLESGPIERFACVGNYASYARTVNSVRLSNGKKKGEGNVRNGNKYLMWAYIEAANMAKRWCPEAKRFYERKKAKTNSVVATKALAHKLARACYHMLKTGQPFDMQRCFAARHAHHHGADGLQQPPASMAGCDKAPHPATHERNCRVRRVKGSLRRAAPALDPAPRH
jgi:transposase